MTVHNGAEYIADAIASLLAQNDPAFEIIVIDDGSVDSTAEVLSQFRDSRLVVRSVKHIGRAYALIEAVHLATGSLLAVLDADDVALPGRLATQRLFLENHPEIALAGSAAVEFDEHHEWMHKVVTGPARVRLALGMYNPFYHSSIMMRRSAYDAAGGYRPDGGWGHDKELLVRIASRFPVDIIPEPLIRHRRHPAQMSKRERGETFRRRKSAAIQLWAARELGLPRAYWLVPIAGWLYAALPRALRPRAIARPVKTLLLRAFGMHGVEPRMSINRPNA